MFMYTLDILYIHHSLSFGMRTANVLWKRIMITYNNDENKLMLLAIFYAKSTSEQTVE